MGDNCRNNQGTNEGLMDEIKTQTKFDAKCMRQIQYEKVDKNFKKNTLNILNIFPVNLLFKKKKTAKRSTKFSWMFGSYYGNNAE